MPDLTGAAVGTTAFVSTAEKCLFGTDKQFRGVDKPFGGTLGHFDCLDDDDDDDDDCYYDDDVKDRLHAADIEE